MASPFRARAQIGEKTAIYLRQIVQTKHCSHKAGSVQHFASCPTAATSQILPSFWPMCLVSCPPFSHAVAILKLVSPTDWVEGSQCSPPVSNDDTAQSAPTICGVCIRELVACERSIHVGFHATATNRLQMGAPLLTPPVFGIQHQGCEIDTAMPADETIASRGGKTSFDIGLPCFCVLLRVRGSLTLRVCAVCSTFSLYGIFRGTCSTWSTLWCFYAAGRKTG